MGRTFLIVVLAGIVLLGAAVLVLGTFPPTPKTQPVTRVLPNDKFQAR